MPTSPEIIIQNIIARGIVETRKDDLAIDVLLRNVNQDVVAALKGLFRNMPVNVAFNYPKTPAELPSIVLLLQDEQETEFVLGDVLGEGVGPATVNGFAAAGSIERGNIGSSIDSAFFFNIDGSPAETLYDPETKLIGEPRKLFQDDFPQKRREGSGFTGTILMQIFATKKEIVLFLFYLVKFIVGRYRMAFERNGILNIKLAATDFADVPEELADFSYSRSISFSFFYWFDWFLIQGREGIMGFGQDDYAEAIALELTAIDHGTDESVVVKPLSQLPAISTIAPIQVPVNTQSIIIISGTNLMNGADVMFSQLDYNSDSNTGIRVDEIEYIDGQKLRVTITPLVTTGATDVVVINPDFVNAIKKAGLTVV